MVLIRIVLCYSYCATRGGGLPPCVVVVGVVCFVGLGLASFVRTVKKDIGST